MRRSINIISAFTDETKTVLGNPAGILISDTRLADDEMAALAMCAAKPMTAFLFPLDDSYTNYNIRYFDFNGQENHICGHATIASASQLFRENSRLRGEALRFYLNPTFFNGESKILTAYFDERNDAVSLDLFQSDLRNVTSNLFHEKIASTLCINQADIVSASFSMNIKDYVVSVKNHDVLMSMQPKFESLKEVAETGEFQHQGLMMTSLAPKGSEFDFYVRAFLPIAGIEDIACGSANCSVVPFWHRKGLNVETKKYKVLFPFPPGPKGHVGGVQQIFYDNVSGNVRLTAQTRYEGELNLGDCLPKLKTGSQLHFI